MRYPSYSVLSSIYIKENPIHFEKCIESIINQTVLTNDFVIIKDGPITRELEGVIDNYTKMYPFIRVYGYDTNKGLGYALNFGLKKCKNNLIARMDTDDISLPNRCERELQEFVADPDLDIVGTSILEFVGEENNIVSEKRMPETNKEIKKYSHKRNPFNHPTVMYKKDRVLFHGGYPEGKRGEDIALFTKMIFEGCKGKNINEQLFLYRADDKQFRRRTSKMDSKAVIDVARTNYLARYITLADYLYIVIAHRVGMIIPSMIGRRLFRLLFRTRCR